MAAGAGSVSERLQRLLDSAVRDDQQFLSADDAFRFQAIAAAADSVLLSWDIADGYYLYRDKFSFAVADGAVRLDPATVLIPRGTIKQDEVFGRVEVNTGRVEILLPLLRDPGPELPIALNIGYQGCKDRSICYPPIQRRAGLLLAAGGDPGRAAAAIPPPAGDGFTERLGQAGLIANLLAFFGFGLALSLTPCVFPMIPILSGIIIGAGGSVTPRRGLLLSGAYVLAMALTYAVFGIVAGSFQFNLQAASQAPWVVTLFSAVFIVLALSMFGLFELQLPAALRAHLVALGDRQGRGTLRAAASLGALSALIVGPCVAPPLAAALLYIARTGDAVLGGAVLFAMGLGFGIPLLIIGVSAGGLLPKAGPWMQKVRSVFGVVMLGVAVWFLERILPGPITLTLWALLFITSAVYMGALDSSADGPAGRVWRGAGLAMLLYGALLIVGALSGGDDALRPLEPLTRAVDPGQRRQSLPFRTVASLGELNAELLRASREGRPVMLDFYADWCVTCKEMERHTFPDGRVRELLSHAVLLQADVTRYDSAARELLEAYHLPGPPAILFFDAGAGERRDYRLIGFVAAERFVAHLRGAFSS